MRTYFLWMLYMINVLLILLVNSIETGMEMINFNKCKSLFPFINISNCDCFFAVLNKHKLSDKWSLLGRYSILKYVVQYLD